jgi:predicted phosphodiesterase
MKAGIISDSYGNLEYLKDSTDYLLDTARVDKLFHLGAFYNDYDSLLSLEKSLAKGIVEYSDTNFLDDIQEFISDKMRTESEEVMLEDRSEGDKVTQIKRNLVRVASRECPQYSDPLIPKKAVEVMDGYIVLLVHNVKDLTREDIANSNIVLYGNTLIHQLDTPSGKYFINPGHLKSASEKGRPPSFSLLTTAPDRISLKVYGLDKVELFGSEFKIEKKNKFTVR